MALSTYSDLQSALTAWFARNGSTDTTISDRATDFIALCEARINYGSADGQFGSAPLRVRAMETSATLTTSTGVVSVSLPTGYLGLRRIYISGSPPQALVQYSPELNASMSQSAVAGRPQLYDIVGDTIEFTPIPDGAYDVVVVYYKAVPALTVSATTNWLLTAKPDVYLYGSLLEAALFIGDDTSAAKFFRSFSGAVNSLQQQDMRDRYHKPVIRTDISPI